MARLYNGVLFQWAWKPSPYGSCFIPVHPSVTTWVINLSTNGTPVS
ncbi:MAG: hypothetical protein RID53_21765 [Coleofasciculus sp. B1-GNL1-01]